MSISDGIGLLEELGDRAVVVVADEAEGRGVLDRIEAERGAGAAGDVLVHQRGQVEVGERVAVEREEAILEQVLGELDRARGAAGLGLLDVAQSRPAGDLVAERGPELVGQEAARHHDLLHPVPRHPVDHVAQERPVDQWDDRLREGEGDRAQAGAVPPDEDQRLHDDSRSGGSIGSGFLPARPVSGPVAAPSDPLVGEPGGSQGLGVEEVPAVDEQRRRHPAGDARSSRAPRTAATR